MADASPSRLIFGDFSEIRHVLELIREQSEELRDCDQPMATARYLAGLLRRELIDHGGAESHEIADVSDIIHWYMVHTVEPGMWQFHFAECLASLELYFSSPFGPPENTADSLRIQTEIDRLEARCVAVLLSDHLRHAIHEGRAFKTKASALSEHLAAIRPFAERGEVQLKNLAQMRDSARSASLKYDDSKKEAWRRFDEEKLKKSGRPRNKTDRIRAVIQEFKLPEKSSRTVSRALFEKKS